MMTGYPRTRNDIPGASVSRDVWFHFGMTWPGPGNIFKVFIDGVFVQNSTIGMNYNPL